MRQARPPLAMVCLAVPVAEMTKIFDREEAERLGWVYKGETIKDYEIACRIPDMDKFMQTVISGQMEYVIKTEYNNILMCAQPKSGSQHTYKIISRSLGYDSLEVGFNFKGGMFYYPRMFAIKYTYKNTISHCHAQLHHDMEYIVNGLDLRVLVHTRNLLDGLVSRRDRMFTFMPKMKSLEGFLSSGDERQLDVIVEMYANDYINFFTGWEQYEGDVMRTTYEEMVADEAGLVGRVADWLGADVIGDVEEISKDIKEAGGISFNKGIIGRGEKLFNDRQKEEIRRRADILGCTNEEFLGGL